jgi:hypothetical protein
MMPDLTHWEHRERLAWPLRARLAQAKWVTTMVSPLMYRVDC